MKRCHHFILPALVLITVSCDQSQKETVRDYPFTPVDFTRVQLEEGFWKKWVETAKEATIPYAFGKCEETGRIDNFRFAAGLEEGRFRGRFGFDDSDVYKIIEGASYALMLQDDPELDRYLDTLISYIAGAQEKDGYLYTPWTLEANDYNEFACCSYSPEGQWKGTTDASHEFYNAGHMYEAAAAHYMATGKGNFLDVALKNADLIYDVCITQGHDYVPGHQEIEIGLVRLYRITGDGKYLELSRHLLDTRAEVKDGEYGQAHLPVTEQREAVGHAVRANYMYSAMADITALTGDTAYLKAVEGLWENVAGKKLSITGAVGASHQGEAYGGNFDLPNDPYNETCAAIANVYWNHRMFLLSGESRYMDVLERTLYNGVLSGLSMSGTGFFYPNTLRHDGQHGFNRGANGRSPWFDCSCCPSNLSRFIPSVAGYAYAVKDDQIYVNLYMNGRAGLQTKGGELMLVQHTRYPWEGSVELEVIPQRDTEATLHLRVPGWAGNRPVPTGLFRFLNEPEELPVLSLNGEIIPVDPDQGYITIKRNWSRGDRIILDLPMQPRLVTADDRVEAKNGLVAVQYGPLVYCAEETDNSSDVLEAAVDQSTRFSARYDRDLLGGVTVLEGDGLVLVPYYSWANREIGDMNVWFKMAGYDLGRHHKGF